MTKSTFYCHHQAMCTSIESVAKRSMEEAVKHVLEVNNVAEFPSRIAVTVDGTWMKRGFSSLYGVVFVVSWQTGQVVDFHVMSKHCSRCRHWKARRRTEAISQEEYAAWRAEHDPSCDVNTHASAPAMETEGVCELFRRSQSHGLLYTSYIGDGDSKGYQAVVADKPHGDVEIVKEECVGHVAKRLGKALRDLKKTKTVLSDGKLLGGKGRLTDQMCDKLQNYYALAIKNGQKQPGDPVTNMAKLIWASLMHCVSTDDHPQHQFCPSDEQSFCGWQQWKAGRCESYKHHDSLPQAVYEAIKPTYIRLADRPLLERCCRGATQNQNESLNGLVWQYCPKTSFCGLDTVKAAVGLAVLKFNHGAEMLKMVLDEMGCLDLPVTTDGLQKADEERLYFAKRKHSSEEKDARKQRRRHRKGLEEDTLEAEGTTSEAGSF